MDNLYERDDGTFLLEVIMTDRFPNFADLAEHYARKSAKIRLLVLATCPNGSRPAKAYLVRLTAVNMKISSQCLRGFPNALLLASPGALTRRLR